MSNSKLIPDRDKNPLKLDLLRSRKSRRVETNGSDRDLELRRNILVPDDPGRDLEKENGHDQDLGTKDRRLRERNIRDVHVLGQGRNRTGLVERLEGLVLDLGEERQDQDLETEGRNPEIKDQDRGTESRNLEIEDRNPETKSQPEDRSLLTEAQSESLLRDLETKIRRKGL